MKWHKVLDEIGTRKVPRPNRRYFEKSGYTEEQYEEARNHYWETERESSEMMKNAMLDDTGLLGHPKADKVWDYAYEQGHASGWNDVYQCLEELANIVLD